MGPHTGSSAAAKNPNVTSASVRTPCVGHRIGESEILLTNLALI